MRKCLLGRVNDILKNKNISLRQYLLNSDKIVSMFKYKTPNGVNGYIDTIRYLVTDYDDDSREVLKLLLKAY